MEVRALLVCLATARGVLLAGHAGRPSDSWHCDRPQRRDPPRRPIPDCRVELSRRSLRASRVRCWPLREYTHEGALLLRSPPSREEQRGSDVPRAGLAEPQTIGIAELFALHHRQVAVWVRRLGGPGIEIEDSVQEVFLLALRRLHRFKGRERLIVWLYRITEHVVLHQRRRLWRRGRILSGSPTEELAAEVPSPGPLPVDQVAKVQALRLMYDVLDRMSEPNRTLFILFEIEGHSGQEIAELKDARVSTVWVWLHRARAEFRRQLRASKRAKHALPGPIP
jgi:RNA polymerase sigma-70 factor, ECF subfamily